MFSRATLGNRERHAEDGVPARACRTKGEWILASVLSRMFHVEVIATDVPLGHDSAALVVALVRPGAVKGAG